MPIECDFHCCTQENKITRKLEMLKKSTRKFKFQNYPQFLISYTSSLDDEIELVFF